MKRLSAGIAALSLAGCVTLVNTHGYVPSEEQLSELVVGVDTRDSVEDVVGPPGASGVLRDERWYYISSTFHTRAALAPKEVERELVAISFDEEGTITNIERFGLEDGQVIALNRRVTDDNVKGVSFIRQLLGNLGNFAADQFFDDV
ncbi:outer membrane protein assembly factor BamE [Actibacterium mucosum]|nr:outer membrane protein assembly factor BamE [Actibacterium mucosum]